MKKRFKVISIVLLIILLGAILANRFLWNKKHRDPEQEDSIQVTSSMLYESMYLQGKKEFLDRTLTISGRIKEIIQTDSTAVCVLDVPQNQDAGIRVSMGQSHITELNAYQTNQQIILKGICTGVLADTLMEEIIMVDIQIREGLLQKN